MDCQQFLDRVSDLLDADLDAATASAARAHAAACPSCAAVLSSSQQMLGWMADPRTFAMPAAAAVRLRERLEERLEQGLGQRSAPARNARPRPAHRWAWAWLWLRPRWAVALMLIVLVAGLARWRASATTISGWLIDQNCATNYHGHAADHTSNCLRHCAARGVALGLLDAKGQFRRFDAQGNRSARAVLASTPAADHLWVTVKARAASHGVLDVEQLALTSPPQ